MEDRNRRECEHLERPWIPLSPDRKVITSRGQTVISSVSDLIDPTTVTWDDDLVELFFNLVDARQILQIPLNFGAFEISSCGTGTMKDIFLSSLRRVCSGYELSWPCKCYGSPRRLCYLLAA